MSRGLGWFLCVAAGVAPSGRARAIDEAGVNADAGEQLEGCGVDAGEELAMIDRDGAGHRWVRFASSR